IALSTRSFEELVDMKKLILVIATGVAYAASWASSVDEYAVNDAMYHLTAAMIAGDARRMRELTNDSLTYGQSDGSIQNQAAFVDGITSGRTRYRRIDLTHTVTTVTGGNAIVRGHFSATTESAGRFVEVDLNEMLVWQKQNGRWRLLSRQGCKF
ncbi:nuclear transport factor 2 family protein, partial [Paraburkholderia terrae]